MIKIKEIFFNLLIVTSIASFLSGCGRQSEHSLKQLIVKHKYAFEKIGEIKKELFIKGDTIEYYHIENTGKRFNQERKWVRNGNDYYSVSNFLKAEEEENIRPFMSKNDISNIFLYENRMEFYFWGSDEMIITDKGVANDNYGIEIEKNIYFHPWTPN